mgnify:FL=1
MIGYLEIENLKFNLLAKIELNDDLIVLSKTPHSIQLLCKNDDIKSVLVKLSKLVNSKQIKSN